MFLIVSPINICKSFSLYLTFNLLNSSLLLGYFIFFVYHCFLTLHFSLALLLTLTFHHNIYIHLAATFFHPQTWVASGKALSKLVNNQIQRHISLIILTSFYKVFDIRAKILQILLFRVSISFPWVQNFFLVSFTSFVSCVKLYTKVLSYAGLSSSCMTFFHSQTFFDLS